MLRTKILATAEGKNSKTVVLFSDHAQASDCDNLLWTIKATGFLPHCMARDSERGPATPVLIASLSDSGELPLGEYLFNFCPEAPPSFSSFKRLIEILPGAYADDIAAHKRKDKYIHRGHDLELYDCKTQTKRTLS